MPDFSPFAGVRYDTADADLGELTAPPYDVIDDADRAALAARHTHNAVHLDLPVDDPDGTDRYAAACRLLHRWLDEGVLTTEDHDVFYGYRMSFTDAAGRHRHTTGVIGALTLSRPDEGSILPHEHTTPKAKSDRLQMLRSCRANLSAIWVLTPAPITDLVGGPAAGDPVWTDEDGTEHALWVIDEPDTVAALSAAVASRPVVVADGHHRYETSLAYRDERRAEAGGAAGSAGAAEATMALVVELVADELTVWPTHRIVSDLPDGFDVAAALDPWFEVDGPVELDGTTVDEMVGSGTLVLVQPGSAIALRPRPEAFAEVRDLDTSRVDAVLATLPDPSVRYHHDIDEVVRAVEAGDADAGILVRPATVEAIAETADGGERMPPKTTFFHPKPRTGPVFRLLD
jgi:uncharacterized protein (DUF1015 family)